jgi:hypothetical protein
MLVGTCPFKGVNEGDLLNNIKTKALKIPSDIPVSRTAIDILAKVLSDTLFSLFISLILLSFSLSLYLILISLSLSLSLVARAYHQQKSKHSTTFDDHETT